jgi:molecular chaperone DnaJ
MAKRDFYEVLGVDRNATDGDIKSAYRKKALENHPDRNPGDTEAETRFKEAAEAYEVLRNPETRRQYDLYGHAGLRGANVRGFSGFEDIFAAFSDIFSGGSIFEDLFGMGGRRVRKGPSLKCRIRIDFHGMARGVEKVIELSRHTHCTECAGSGAAAGSSRSTCSTCGGAGQVVQSQGFFSLRTTCPQCHGEGSIIEDPCKKCKGTGRVKEKKDLSIGIPAGIESGQTLILEGEGEPGPPGGVSGDLHCLIEVEPHEFFQRHSLDVVCQVPVPYPVIVLGGEIEVPTLEGPISLKIPKGTPSGKILRVRGRGIEWDGRRGDQLVSVYVDVPRKVTRRQKELLKELGEIDNKNVSPERKSFLGALKRMFTDKDKS